VRTISGTFLISRQNTIRTTSNVKVAQSLLPLGCDCPGTYGCSRLFHKSASKWQQEDRQEHDPEDDIEETAVEEELRPVIDVATSIKYLQSKAYSITYGTAKVWEPYRRNHKGAIPPEKTRKNCMISGKVATGNPCPICRDEYLVLDPMNTELLKQFISPYTGEVLPYTRTGICQKQHRNLLIAVHQAWDLGYIEKPLPHRKYDYKQYYSENAVNQ